MERFTEVEMANRRMFSKDIVNSARFLRMPQTSRLLYYDLGMAADDEGVVEAFTVMRMTGSTEDDLRVLAARGFIKVLNEDLVSYITDWKCNNQIRADRSKESIYHNLIVQVNSIENIEEFNENSTWQPNDGQMTDKCQPNDNQKPTKYRLGKERLGKNSEGDINISSCTEPETVSMPEPAFISLPLNDGSLWPVTFSYLEKLKGLYPAVDVEQEIRKMFAWLDSRPSNRKTKRGIKAFITNWLNRTQNSARSVPPAANTSGYKTKKQRVDDELVDFVNAMGGM
ncbi:MAG: hypothetical protein MJ097_02240 [Dorea sp.]|nr:hypothetical protein [Dorea sp.]